VVVVMMSAQSKQQRRPCAAHTATGVERTARSMEPQTHADDERAVVLLGSGVLLAQAAVLVVLCQDSSCWSLHLSLLAACCVTGPGWL
jgi:hypothetical protein